MSTLNIFISAGDPSGERHAARLINELKEIGVELTVTGIGGPAMQEAGARLFCTQDRLAVMGLVEVVAHLKFFFRLLASIRKHLQQQKPDLLVLIDFPDFNLRLARIAKKLGIPVLYYISPQVWAWRTGRKRSLARLVDRMAVVFPFEVNFYRGENLEVEFVGHPLVGDLAPRYSRQQFCQLNSLDPNRLIVGLMPGSRAQELNHHLSVFLAAAELMRSRSPDLQFAVGLLPHTAAALSRHDRQLLDKLEVRRIDNDSTSLIAHSRVLITKSGTTTMEAALLGTPMVIAYRTNPLSYWIARHLVQVNYIGMPNLLASNPAIPELIQDQVCPELLAQKALELLDESSPARERILAQFRQVREALTTEKGTSRRVAEIVLEMCTQGRQG
jgi:lipid-A-disaccharide synthase